MKAKLRFAQYEYWLMSSDLWVATGACANGTWPMSSMMRRHGGIKVPAIYKVIYCAHFQCKPLLTTKTSANAWSAVFHNGSSSAISGQHLLCLQRTRHFLNMSSVPASNPLLLETIFSVCKIPNKLVKRYVFFLGGA